MALLNCILIEQRIVVRGIYRCPAVTRSCVSKRWIAGIVIGQPGVCEPTELRSKRVKCNLAARPPLKGERILTEKGCTMRIAKSPCRINHTSAFRWAGSLVSLALTVGYIPEVAQAFEVRISAGTVHYQSYILSGVTGRIDEGGVSLNVKSLATPADAELAFTALNLGCSGVDFKSDNICSAGTWSFELADAAGTWKLPLGGTLERITRENDEWRLQSGMSSGKLHARISAHLDAEQLEAAISWKQVTIQDLPAISLIPAQVKWVDAGACSGQLVLRRSDAGAVSIDFDIALKGLGFDSPEGRFAGENLGARASGTLRLDDMLHTQVSGKIDSGALLLDNFYASFSDRSVQWGARMSKKGTSLHVAEMHLGDGSSVDIKAEADVDLANPMKILSYRVSHFEMHFPEAYQRYIESMAAAWTLNGLTVTGNLLWSGERQSGPTVSGVLDVQDLSVVDNKRGRFAVTGLAAHIAPGEQGAESRFSWRGLLLQRINLGAGEAAVKAEPGQFSLASPLRLEVLGGKLALDELHVKLPGNSATPESEPEIRLYATLEDMDMERLTKALGWPSFGGTISGKIPGVTLHNGVLAVEGQIEFNVFDGQILLSGLRIERPFGVLPSLAADLEANNLDLQQLTHTFSFGSISGRMSGFVHDLRMLDWKPVAFDAWFGTPGQEAGSHKISRQAVNHLTTIGGGSATAALSGPLLKFFNNFSYRRLGLGCHLQNYICEVRGLDDDPASVLIMEGAGVPKIMIRAFNRQMDWPTLLAGLTAASQGESIKIGDK